MQQNLCGAPPIGFAAQILKDAPNEFRLRHLGALPHLFVQVLTLCDRAGLLKLEHVLLDGSKVKANASKHKAMSHGRMESEVERLEGEIQELLTKAKDVDQEEDELYGEDKDSQSESQEELVPKRPSAETPPVTQWLSSRVYSVQAPSRRVEIPVFYFNSRFSSSELLKRELKRYNHRA